MSDDVRNIKTFGLNRIQHVENPTSEITFEGDENSFPVDGS